MRRWEQTKGEASELGEATPARVKNVLQKDGPRLSTKDTQNQAWHRKLRRVGMGFEDPTQAKAQFVTNVQEPGAMTPSGPSQACPLAGLGEPQASSEVLACQTPILPGLLGPCPSPFPSMVLLPPHQLLRFQPPNQDCGVQGQARNPLPNSACVSQRSGPF